MKTNKTLSLALFAFSLVGVLGAKCPSIPSIQEAIVELVKAESAVVGPFIAEGNDVADDGTLDLVSAFSVSETLDEAGVDVDKVESMTVKSVEVRTSVPDPDPERRIDGGTVRARLASFVPRGGCPVGGAFATVVSNWSGRVNDYQTFSTANVEVSQAGIDVLNCILEFYLQELKNGNDPESLVVEWQVDGTTSPATDANFQWEVRVTIEIVGELEVDVIG